MGRRRPHGREPGVIDCAGCWAVGAVYLLGDREEGCYECFLDGGFGYGGAIWRFVVPLFFTPVLEIR